MTLYAIGEKSPQLPDEENYWIAPGAHVMGQVIIGNNVWIGNGVSILKGSVIPSGSVLAANTVVLGQLEERGVYGGVPCKLLKKL